MSDEETKKEDVKDTPSEPLPDTDSSSSEHQAVDKEKVYYRQVIKSCWTHEPWLYFKVIVKSNEEMGEYIALHGLVPQNELPLHLRHKIPENEIWMREDIYVDVARRRQILAHEFAELDLMMTYAISYKEAHAQAEFFEHLFYPKADKL
jgi:CDP-glycerol glycerophosphotransferase (TagB/SpsB family)